MYGVMFLIFLIASNKGWFMITKKRLKIEKYANFFCREQQNIDFSIAFV